MSFTFKYKPVKLKSGKIARRPLIPFTLSGVNETLDFFGILDTGSDITIIPREIAEVLGVDYVGENEVYGLSGRKINANDGYLDITFGKGREIHTFTIPILVPKEKGSQIIIGRMGFFEQFKITFCEAEQRMIFKKLKWQLKYN